MTTAKTTCSELLMPAGSLEKLKVAVLYGADAVYLGTPDMSLRSTSEFTLDEVIEGIAFAHDHGKHVYLTLNLFSHNKDIEKLPDYVDTVQKVNPDGLIVADPGIFMYVRERAPDLELHVSTQANSCSWQSVRFWQSQGAGLCVLGREVSFAELAEIREKCPDIKLETFVHGSMCMTYSGRCLLSNFMTERGANQGSCANSCRWKYKLHMKLKDGTVKELNLSDDNLDLFEFLIEEDVRPGELMPIEEDERGSYILNSRDLCLMPKLDDYLRLGIDSLKVEGRGKSPYYVALVARAYRRAIDAWTRDPDNWCAEDYMKDLETVPSRGYTFAFHDGRLTNHAHGYDDTSSLAAWEYAGMIREVHGDAFIVTVKNRLEAGDVLEFIPPGAGDPVLLRIYEFERESDGTVTKVVNPGHQPVIRIPLALFDREDPVRLKQRLPPLTVIRKEKALTATEWNRLKLDAETRNMEGGENRCQFYEKRRAALHASIDEKDASRRFKTPRLGTEGCCGKGCNGCLIFWHDPNYAPARQLLASKKQGEMLNGKPVANTSA